MLVKNRSKSIAAVGLEVAAIAGLLSCILIPILYWSKLPDSIPIRFISKPDVWSGKGSIFLLPIFCIGLYLMLSGVVWLQRHTEQLESPKLGEEQKHLLGEIGIFSILRIKTIVMWLFAYIEWRNVLIATGKVSSLGVGTNLIILALFASIIYIFIRYLIFTRGMQRD